MILCENSLMFETYVAVQKKGYIDLQEAIREESESCSYGSTLQNDPNCTLPCTWAASDPSLFLVRGETYFQDHQKVFYQF
jgi:hypothetical protein